MKMMSGFWFVCVFAFAFYALSQIAQIKNYYSTVCIMNRKSTYQLNCKFDQFAVLVYFRKSVIM